MKPHVPNTGVDALPDNLDGDVWRSRDHHAVKPPWHGPDVSVTCSSLQLLGLRVDGKHLVPSASQFTEHGVGGLAWLPRNAGHGNAPSAKKCGDGLWSLDHGSPLCLAGFPASRDEAAITRAPTAWRAACMLQSRQMLDGLLTRSSRDCRRQDSVTMRTASHPPEATLDPEETTAVPFVLDAKPLAWGFRSSPGRPEGRPLLSKAL
jgi:hypothetical protein